jgi:selT/selW/selH-like putative selenoprotein
MLEEARGHIDYDEEGLGSTVVFVPGSWGTRSAWRGVIEELHDRYRIITTSLLGYGATDERRTVTQTSIESEAEIVVEAVILRAGGAPDATGGVFEVRLNGEVIWSRKERGSFPEIKEIKGRSLGHSDTP